MKIITTLLFASSLMAQTLPPANTITAGGTTCTFSVADAEMSVATECLLADGTIMARSIHTPTIKGDLLGSGPIKCLLSTDGAASPAVRLQCMTDDDTSGPKIVIDGRLAPATRKRQWWLFWR